MKVFFCLLTGGMPKIYICFYISCRRALFCAEVCRGAVVQWLLWPQRCGAAAGMTCRCCILCMQPYLQQGIFRKVSAFMATIIIR